jgi:cytoskeletal protein CcmA (bactofilin family)
MLNFGRRDRFTEGKSIDKSTLKPALYEPPVSAGRSTASTLDPRAASQSGTHTPHTAHPTHTPPAEAVAEPPLLAVDEALQSAAASLSEPVVSKLAVGVNVKLKGVDISDCDVLVIEGHVEATVHSKAMEIAMPGTLRGTAIIDVAEIYGEFSGDLTARTRLVVHGTGRVSGTIRYGKLIVAEGGELNGDVKRLDEALEPAQTARPLSPIGALGPAPGSIVGSH